MESGCVARGYEDRWEKRIVNYGGGIFVKKIRDASISDRLQNGEDSSWIGECKLHWCLETILIVFHG